jgi:hypothetical protein
MAKGDLFSIDALLQRYVNISPTVDAALKRIGADPPSPRFVYRTADQLDPP